MAGCNSRLTSLECRLKLSKDSKEPLVDATDYRTIVRSLRYLVNTRPDIAFVVSYVSRFLSEPHEDHLMAFKHILCYVAETVNWGIHVKKGSGEIVLVGFSDSDFAGDVDSRKSISGVFFFLDRSPVTWQSTKHNIVAQLSCDAEYVAVANGTCQALWLGRVMGELLGTEAFVPKLMGDFSCGVDQESSPEQSKQTHRGEVSPGARKCRARENSGKIGQNR
jgi:hypothetical protein